jgi:hypothetical protein
MKHYFIGQFVVNDARMIVETQRILHPSHLVDKTRSVKNFYVDWPHTGSSGCFLISSGTHRLPDPDGIAMPGAKP